MTKFEYTPEFAEDLEAYYGVTIANLEQWIKQCEDDGRITAYHHEIEFRMKSRVSWPTKEHLVFTIDMWSNGDTIDTKYLISQPYVKPTVTTEPK